MKLILFLYLLRLTSFVGNFRRRSEGGNLIILKGGIGDTIIALKHLNALSNENNTWNVLVPEEHVLLLNKYLNKSIKIHARVEENFIFENNISKIYSLRSDLNDYKLMIQSLGRCEIKLNPIYDSPRILSRVMCKISDKYRKKFYKKKHVSDIFAEILSVQEQSGNTILKINKNYQFNSDEKKRARIGIHVSGSEAIRRLRSDFVKEFIKLYPNSSIYLFGGALDERDYRDVSENFANCENLINKINLIELGEILEKMDVIIGPDSMVVHYADMLNKVVVALMGNALPETYGPINNPNSRIISRNSRCSPCGRRECHIYDGYSCVQDITAAEIKLVVDKVLSDVF